MTEEAHQQKRKFVSDIFYLALGSNYAQLVAAISGLVIRRLIGPTLSGLFGLLNMIYLYSDYVYSPFRGGLAREVPYHKGVKDQKSVDEIRKGSFSIILALSLFINVGLLIASYIVPENKTGLLRWSLRIYAPISFLMALCNYLIVFSRTEKQFFKLFKYYAFNSTLLAVLTIVLTYYYAFKGLLLSSLFVGIVSTFYFFKLVNYPFRFSLPGRIIRLLVVRGTPVILYSIIFLNFKQIDRLLVISFLGLTEMGYYGIGITMCNLVFLIPASIWQVVFPGFLERGARFKTDVSPLKSEVFHNTRTVADVVPVFFTLSTFGVSFLIVYGLPAFKPGIVPAQILLLGTFFIGLYNMFFYLFVIRDRMRYVIGLSLFYLVLAAALDYAAIRLETGIIGVAAATLICFFLFNCSIILIAGILLLHSSLKEIIQLLLRLWLPFFYAVLIFYPVNRLLCPRGDNFWYDALRFISGTVIIFISYLPFWVSVDKKTKLLTTLGKDLTEKFYKLRTLMLGK